MIHRHCPQSPTALRHFNLSLVIDQVPLETFVLLMLCLALTVDGAQPKLFWPFCSLGRIRGESTDRFCVAVVLDLRRYLRVEAFFASTTRRTLIRCLLYIRALKALRPISEYMAHAMLLFGAGVAGRAWCSQSKTHSKGGTTPKENTTNLHIPLVGT